MECAIYRVSHASFRPRPLFTASGGMSGMEGYASQLTIYCCWRFRSLPGRMCEAHLAPEDSSSALFEKSLKHFVFFLLIRSKYGMQQLQ
ncbi:hypothetical protein CDAR_91911 [Caerostris darwini]|uniref:Uncharacterized protein n=1 Tax=Caerostris darwini TaxID=1538125 RepID=A0AAV4QMT5_9ARAC|nr:hypothetical protein CDAR_91911 [Caerostris darwini]